MTKLNTSKLTDAAKLHTTDNEFLKIVYGLVQNYNTMETLPKQEKVYLLERILVGCGHWFNFHLSRPPGPTLRVGRPWMIWPNR